MIVWMGPSKLPVVASPMARTSPVFKRVENAVEHAVGLLPGGPFRLAAQQVFLGDHFQDGPDVLGHAAVDEHERVLQFAARLRRDVGRDRESGGWASGGRG